MPSLNDVFIVSQARTPIASFRGTLSALSAPQLGSIAIKAALKRANITGEDVDEVFFGNALQAGIGQAPARQAAMGAGILHHTDCTTIQKICSSGLKAITISAQSIQTGTNDVVVSGGMESVSNVPYYLYRGDTPFGGITLVDGIVKDGVTDVYLQMSGVLRTEHLVKSYDLSREALDEHAINSYKRSLNSVKSGLLDREIVPVIVSGTKGNADVTVSEDEELKRVDFAKIKTLEPVAENGTITAANTGALSDGAAATILMSEKALKRFQVAPIARIVEVADVGVPPIEFGKAPALAIQQLLEKSGINKSQISHWEINEPFSAVALANIKHLDLDPEKVNPNGGAVSLGHPLAMSGARILNHLAINLKTDEYGVAAICNGGGGSSAMLIQGM
ncbi:Acetyl-CoA acetyltransferase, mitochondrial [Pseudolycoriella hygida]|uniref:Acetyl-CoA acetyltransferase, mitochondrial n=1 Tax=Pseudolycoriella hygida TaxID=35572 RepID=A0A9Q0MJK2_9DIPT|nr:Acetyl-CoA acetyltransferase, mitochondrial [Pseudolycoriella hygida]